MRRFFGVLGVCLAIFSGFMVATAIAELASGGDGKTRMPIYVGLMVFFGGTALAGGYLARSMLWKKTLPILSEAEVEQRVLTFLAKQSGRATVAEVAVRCRIAPRRSQEMLDRLASQSVVSVLVSEDGTIVYSLQGMLTSAERAAAADPIDE